MGTERWRGASGVAKKKFARERLLDFCNRLAGDDYAEESFDAERLRGRLRALVAGVAFSLLMLEILITRMVPFFLGGISAFVSIPIAMFGLSLGALVLHWTGVDARLRWLPLLLPTLLLTTLVSLLLFFGLFNQVFDLAHYGSQNPWTDAPKTVVLTMLFVPVFALGGVIVSTAFTASASTVGRLYAADLFGSAGACLAAPLLLQLMDLPLVICVVLAAQAACWWLAWSAARRKLGLALALGCVVFVPLASSQNLFTEKPDPAILARNYVEGLEAKEIRHRWNAISRVALIRLQDQGRTTSWRLIHDDGISNVFLRRYRPSRVKKPPKDSTPQRIPLLMDERPSSALVMFAGCGKDMVLLNEYAGGTMDITGVELNRLVPRLVSAGRWDRWNLRAFYDQSHIDLRIEEGRSFLHRDRHRYDAIFVATNGAQYASRTGHSRKYLDTYEAMESYLDHLSEEGVMVFNHQKFRHKLEMFKRLAVEWDAAFSDSILILNVGKKRFKGDGMGRSVLAVVKPSGFSPAEVLRVTEMWESVPRRLVYYAPGYEPYPALATLIHDPPDAAVFVPVDDRPYEAPVDMGGFRLFPGVAQLDKMAYAMSWIKIFTMLVTGGFALLLLAAFQLRGRGRADRPRRLPLWLTAYFLVTGIGYMFVQIGLIAKLELFLGNPVFAVSVVLAAYLISNGLGSAWIGRCQSRVDLPPLAVVAGLACVATWMTVELVDLGIETLLGWPLALKIPVTVLGLFPLGCVLGMFYPLGVSLTVRYAQPALVPKTFGLATVSSVLGSTWAIVAVINQGFRSLIEQASIGYAVLFVVTAVPLMLPRSRGAGEKGVFAPSHPPPS